MKKSFRVLNCFVSFILVLSILTNCVSILGQDIISTSDDISDSNLGVFVFKESQKKIQVKVAYKKTTAKRTVANKTETRAKVSLQIQATKQSKPLTQNPSTTLKSLPNPSIKPPKPDQTSTQIQTEASVAYVENAESSLKRKEFDKAVELYRKAVQFDSKNNVAKIGLSDSLILLANQVFESGNAESSRIIYEESIKIISTNATSYAGLGEVYDALEDDTNTPKIASELKNKSIFNYEKALELNPSLSGLFAPLGVLYVEKGEIAKAETILAKATLANPKNAEVQFLLGLVRYKQNLNQEALNSLKKAVKLDPKLSNAHYYLGEVYDRLNRDKEASLAYKQALKINPNFVEAWFDLAVSHYNRGRYLDSITAYKETVRLKNDYLEARVNLADVLRQSNKYEEAISEYRIATVLIERDKETTDSEKSKVFSKYGFCLGKVKQWNSALENLNKAIEYEADDVDYTNLGWAYYNAAVANNQDNKPEEAKQNFKLGRKALEAATKLNPNSIGGLLNLGVILVGNGEIQSGIETLKKADELKKDWDVVKFQLGIVYEQTKDWKNAADQFKRVTEINKDNIYAYYRWGIAENSRNNRIKAQEIIKQMKLMKSANAKALANQLETIVLEKDSANPKIKSEDKPIVVNPIISKLIS